MELAESTSSMCSLLLTTNQKDAVNSYVADSHSLHLLLPLSEPRGEWKEKETSRQVGQLGCSLSRNLRLWLWSYPEFAKSTILPVGPENNVVVWINTFRCEGAQYQPQCFDARLLMWLRMPS